MLIIGAGGHAKEILDILIRLEPNNEFIFYDDVTKGLPAYLFNKFKIIRAIEDAKKLFDKDPRFVLGVGGTQTRKAFAEKFTSIGGKLESIIAPTVIIGNFDVILGKGLNVMHGVFISNNVKIGEGTLINTNATIHHDTIIGDYCEISPGVHITGGCKIGNYCNIGTGAIILPKIEIGDRVIIGAGAVVTRNFPDGVLIKGIPAKISKRKI